MHHRTILASLLTLLALEVSAAPAPSAFQNPAPYNFIAALPSSPPDDNTATHAKRSVGGVRLSDGANFTGHVWYGIYPLDECISLNGYAHNVLSFRPDDGTECLVMQGECNSEADYTDLYHDSPNIGDLGYYDFAAELESYMCLQPITAKEA